VRTLPAFLTHPLLAAHHYPPISSCLAISSCLVQNKLRLDAFLAAKLPAASRARLQASIKEGLVVVNGRQQVGLPLDSDALLLCAARCAVTGACPALLYAGLYA
jgi:hypothetical protein